MYLLFAVLAVCICVYSSIAGAREYKVFKRAKKTSERQYYYKKWIIESYLYFGITSVVMLLLLHKADNLFTPIVHRGLSSTIPAFVKSDQGSINSFYIGAGIGLAVALAVTIIRSRKAMKRKLNTAGDIDALLPRNSKERRLGLYTAISAGLNEELFFRALLPTILLGLTHNLVFAIASSILIFALGHIYQGWKGVLATGLMGWIFMKIFLLSGNIFVPIGLHIFIDFWGLILVPYLADRSARLSKTKHSRA